MVTLEQVKLLETKVTKTIDFVGRITEENAFLKGKLDDYQKRIDELEVLIQGFKDDQGRIEDGILSSLDRLNQFEAAMEKNISSIKSIKSAQLTEQTMVPDIEEPAAEPEEKAGTGEPQSEPEAFPGKLFVEDEGEESDEEILFTAGEEGETAEPEGGEGLDPDISPESPELDIF
jgi:chromosome segregation ATPase